uniref:Uncharacterized protein n=1 Tax=Pseudomonas phage Orimi01 TaxID=3138541 RepID=A0AAU6W3E3_9VIRU
MENTKLEITVADGVSVRVTPEILAAAFWSMNSEQQADFMDALGAVIEADHIENASAYSYGELQWCWLKEELRQPGRERANKVHMAISAFAYDFWPQKNDGARTGL